MKKQYLYIYFCAFALIFVLSSCSTQRKNTWLTRTFHTTTTRYNVEFNGEESYNEGLKKIIAANEDNFSAIIPMFPISKHSNASAATSNMDRAIEKSRKSMKLHSIKQKPKRDLKKWNDPEYQAYYNQNEFNPAIKDAWMLIGKAEFHKADFLGSIGSFSYIAKQYPGDKDLVAQSQLWTVQAYVEMDWMYEAEDLLKRINQDDVRYKSIGLFASTNAVYLLKRGEYREAIPFVEMALSREKSKAMKQRFTYLLAQLYQETGNKDAAINSYTSVIKMNPPFVMDFNARISRAQLKADEDLGSILKELRKMIKNSNNKDYLDQIYYVIGNAYIQNGDTAKAIENYQLSIESSTRNGVEKATTLITLGDLYYSEREYINAQPAYSEAATIITNEHNDYTRVSKLAEILGELNIQYSTVVLQDSLQHLATLSPDEQRKIVDKVIEDLIAEEKRAAEKAEELAQRDTDDRFVPIGGPMGVDAGKWYFYNPNLVKSGKQEFQRLWGSRKLEDNWRRSTKSATMFGQDAYADNAVETQEGEIPEGENIEGNNAGRTQEVLDNKKPEYYLRQIPVTPEQIERSNAQIADALMSMGMIYKDKINDYPMAIETYDEFIRRFGADTRVPDAYFQLYLTEIKQEHPHEADVVRRKIIAEYPESRYAQILSQPDYIERFNQMQQEQDSLYAATYKAYSTNDFATVAANTAYARANYSLSKLMPKFMFLEALSIGKTDTPERFEAALNELVTTYPQSDVSAMAKDIAALIRQGREAQVGTSHGSLLTRRADELKAEIEAQEEALDRRFNPEKQSKHRLMLISSAEQQQIYQLMYQIAAFNFTRFMVKEFDLAINQLDETRQVLSVTNFESYDEVEWYKNSINADLTLSGLINQLGILEVTISEENFDAFKVLGLDEYLLFEANSLRGGTTSASKATTPTSKPAQQPAVAEQPKATKPEAKPETTVRPSESVTTRPTPETPQVAETTPMEAPATQETVEEAPQEEIVAETTQPATTAPADEKEEETAVTPAIEEEPEEEVPLYKGLFGYQPEKPHYVALYVISGKINFEKIESDFNAYNEANYGMLNLQVSLETVGSQQIVLIGSFADANIAKSYLLRIVKEKTLFAGLQGTNYRNLLGTQKNLNVMVQKNAFRTYNEFMQEYYMK